MSRGCAEDYAKVSASTPVYCSSMRFWRSVSRDLFLMVLSEQVGAFDICPLKEVWVATWMFGPVIMRDVN